MTSTLAHTAAVAASGARTRRLHTGPISFVWGALELRGTLKRFGLYQSRYRPNLCAEMSNWAAPGAIPGVRRRSDPRSGLALGTVGVGVHPEGPGDPSSSAPPPAHRRQRPRVVTVAYARSHTAGQVQCPERPDHAASMSEPWGYTPCERSECPRSGHLAQSHQPGAARVQAAPVVTANPPIEREHADSLNGPMAARGAPQRRRRGTARPSGPRRRSAMPDRRLGDLGGRRRHGAPPPFRPYGTGQCSRAVCWNASRRRPRRSLHGRSVTLFPPRSPWSR